MCTSVQVVGNRCCKISGDNTIGVCPKVGYIYIHPRFALLIGQVWKHVDQLLDFLGQTNKSTGCGTAGPALWRRFIGRLCLCRRTFAEVCDHEPDYCAAWAQKYEFCGPVWPGLTWLARSRGLFWLVGVVRLRYTAKLDRGYFRCSLRLGLWLNPSLLERGPHFTCAECSIVCCFCCCGWLLVTSRLRIHSP